MQKLKYNFEPKNPNHQEQSKKMLSGTQCVLEIKWDKSGGNKPHLHLVTKIASSYEFISSQTGYHGSRAFEISNGETNEGKCEGKRRKTKRDLALQRNILKILCLSTNPSC